MSAGVAATDRGGYGCDVGGAFDEQLCELRAGKKK